MLRHSLPLLLLSAALSEAGVPAQERPRALRAELDRFAGVLDETLLQVSRPSPASMLGLTSATSAYYVRGLGAIFIAPPRLLPTARPEGTIAVRQQQEGPPPAPTAPDPRRRRAGARSPQGAEIEQVEAQARAMQEAAALAQLQAERMFAEIVASIEGQARGPLPSIGPQSTSARPAEPSAAGPWSLVPPATPPWSLWLEIEGTEDPRTPERVVDDVQQSVSAALANFGPQIDGLAPEERITVIVEFARATPFAPLARPDHTLSVQIKQSDLLAFQRGQLSAEELKTRFDRQEY